MFNLSRMKRSLSLIALTIGVFGFSSIGMADAIYKYQPVNCKNGGQVYRCLFDGINECDVSGQKFCDEAGGIG